MKWKREVRTKVWGTSGALLRILHLHWQRGTQRGLSLGDWQNQHWYWEQKETDEFREKETWQEAPCCLPLMLLKSTSSVSSILLSTRSKFSIGKISFPDILTPFCYYAIYLLCFQSIITAWASEVWLGHQHLLLPSLQGSTVTTWQTQYSSHSHHPACFLCSIWCCGSILYLTPMIQYLFGLLIALWPFLFLLLILSLFPSSPNSLPFSFMHLRNLVIAMQMISKFIFLVLILLQFSFSGYHRIFPLSCSITPINMTCPWMIQPPFSP